MAVSTFLGRDAEQARLLELLTADSLVTITGPGGIGKTRLAAETFGAGVVRCELAALPSGADVDAVAAEGGWATPEAAAVRLAQDSAVLVLDNCEHVLDGAALFVSRLLAADPSLRVVATSREPLGVQGEHVLVLASLAVPKGDLDVEASPAVQLFLDRSRAGGAAWDRSPATLSAIAELCRGLDGLPLAIELAAARARALTPAELLALMERRLDLLTRTGRSPAQAGERHRSLRAAIDVSTDLLEAEERCFLQRLGVFAGVFDVDLAGAVAADPGTDRLHVVDLLGRLVDRSLVIAEHEAEGTRYRLFEVVRAYAIEGLIRAGQHERIAERFVDAAVADADAIVAAAIQQWSGELLARIAARFHDLVAAIRWCVEHDDGPDRAYRLVLPFLAAAHQSRSAEVLAVGRLVLDRWDGAPAPWRSEAMAVLATAAVIAGDRAAALDLGHRAVDDPSSSDPGRAVGHRALGLAARAAGDLDAALKHFAAGRAAAAAFGGASFERELAGFEASMLDQIGSQDEAAALIDWVVSRSVEAADWLTEAWARLVRATMSMQAGDWAAAREECRLARIAIDRLEYKWWQGAALRLEATIVANDNAFAGLERGWSASIDAWRQAIDTAAAEGSLGGLALTLRAAASVAARLGHEPTAQALLEAVPDSTELSVLPLAFPEELARLEASGAPSRPPRDLATAVRRAHAALTVEGDGPVPETRVTTPPAMLRRDGDAWTAEYGGRRAVVRHLKGLTDIVQLLSCPGVELHCVQLMGGADVDAGLGPALDEKARRSYQERIRELQHDIDDAEADGNRELAARAEVELDALVSQLSEAFGLGGRARSQGSTTERARAAVTYRIRAAIKRVGEVHPELGRHLDNAVRTGTWCVYRPETDVVWELQQGAEGAPVRKRRRGGDGG